MLLLLLQSSAGGITYADLYHVIAGTCLASSTLQASFGRTGFLWLDLAPPSESLPVAVLSHVAVDTTDEPAEASGSRTRVEGRTFQVAVYSTDRGNAETLSDAIGDAIEAAATAGSLTHSQGRTIDVERDGVEIGALDPDTSPSGLDVWGHTVQYVAMVVR
jgi:hypothetical protein